MPENGLSVNRGLLRPCDWAPLLELMRARDTEPRFERPNPPVHWATYTDRSSDGVSDALNVLADLACVPLDDKDNAA